MALSSSLRIFSNRLLHPTVCGNRCLDFLSADLHPPQPTVAPFWMMSASRIIILKGAFGISFAFFSFSKMRFSSSVNSRTRICSTLSLRLSSVFSHGTPNAPPRIFSQFHFSSSGLRLTDRVLYMPVPAPMIISDVVALIPKNTPSSHIIESFPNGPPTGLRFHITVSPNSTPSDLAVLPFNLSYAVFPSCPTSPRFNK